jgi:hypothetical protein
VILFVSGLVLLLFANVDKASQTAKQTAP